DLLNPPNSVVYTATKGAVDAVTRVLAKELGPRKIRANSINPGVVETEGTHLAGIIGSGFHRQGALEASHAAGIIVRHFERQAVQQAPLGRFGQPADIAPVALFLASDDARWVSGET